MILCVLRERVNTIDKRYRERTWWKTTVKVFLIPVFIVWVEV